MNAPISDEVEHDLNGGSERGRRAQHLHEAGPQTPGDGFMSDLLDAQQRLISAQHQFLHDQDMRVLARAQLDVIGVQTNVLQRLGIFG